MNSCMKIWNCNWKKNYGSDYSTNQIKDKIHFEHSDAFYVHNTNIWTVTIKDHMMVVLDSDLSRREAEIFLIDMENY